MLWRTGSRRSLSYFHEVDLHGRLHPRLPRHWTVYHVLQYTVHLYLETCMLQVASECATIAGPLAVVEHPKPGG
jgi:hypothetical protein